MVCCKTLHQASRKKEAYHGQAVRYGQSAYCTKILDFRVFDSSGIFILRGGIPMSIVFVPESLSQQIFIGTILVGRSGVPAAPVALSPDFEKVIRNLNADAVREQLDAGESPPALRVSRPRSLS